MVLNFLGSGSGFSDNHTSAYFTTNDKELVIIDCPVSAFQKLKRMKLGDYEQIYVFVTHTHGDHVGGLGLFAQYVFFVLKKKLTIVAPSSDMFEDILTIMKIEGNDSEWYNLEHVLNLAEKPWLKGCIPTVHSPQLERKCFGYKFFANGETIIYTGDTATLKHFLERMEDVKELYVDTSVYYGMIHLKLEDALPKFLELNQSGVEVFLMHLDDANAAEKIVANYPKINVVR